MSAAALSPCTRAGRITRCAFGCRRRSTLMMSRSAAPSSEVTMPILRGRAGSGRLREAAKSPSACSFFFNCSNASCSAPRPRGWRCSHCELVLALRLVDAEPPAGDDVQAVLEAEAQIAHRRAEHHRLDLRAVVLEREVGVAGVPDAAVGDLTFDPDVAEARLEGPADRRGQFRDRLDAPLRRPRRRPRLIALVVFERLREEIGHRRIRAGRWRRAPRQAPRLRTGTG